MSYKKQLASSVKHFFNFSFFLLGRCGGGMSSSKYQNAVWEYQWMCG